MTRRMFSDAIVNSDAFLDMGQGAQVLYFHLAMRADDDGFVNPKSVMRMLGIADDELRVLLSKRFLLPFDSGVVVIKHWLIHNLIRADLYKETQYKKEKSLLGLNENGAYTEMRDGVAEIKTVEAPKWLRIRRGEERTANVPQTARRLGKDRIGKVRLIENTESAVVVEKKEFQSISYLSEIPQEDMTGFMQRYDISEDKVKKVAESLKNYCEMHGKKYKNYKAFLNNALLRDFGTKDEQKLRIY